MWCIFANRYTKLSKQIEPSIWNDFTDIMHIKVNNGSKLAILNLIQLKLFKPYPSLKLHILFYGNGIANWHGLSDISNI